MIKILNSLFVTLFGIGKLKYAPGTVASLITILMLFYFFHFIRISPHLVLTILLVILIFSFFAVHFYIKNQVNKDPKEVVIDEVIGQAIPIYLFEISHNVNKSSEDSFLMYIYIFILFRIFDIKKPFPINYVDKKFKNSFGVILDDIIAGFYVVLTLIIFMSLKLKLL